MVRMACNGSASTRIFVVSTDVAGNIAKLRAPSRRWPEDSCTLPAQGRIEEERRKQKRNEHRQVIRLPHNASAQKKRPVPSTNTARLMSTASAFGRDHRVLPRTGSGKTNTFLSSGFVRAIQ